MHALNPEYRARRSLLARSTKNTDATRRITDASRRIYTTITDEYRRTNIEHESRRITHPCSIHFGRPQLISRVCPVSRGIAQLVNPTTNHTTTRNIRNKQSTARTDARIIRRSKDTKWIRRTECSYCHTHSEMPTKYWRNMRLPLLEPHPRRLWITRTGIHAIHIPIALPRRPVLMTLFQRS